MNTLAYRLGDQFAPIPPDEKDLQSVTANYWLQIHQTQALHGEGTCFDREGNLYFTIIYEGRVCRIDAKTKKIATIFHDEERKIPSVKIHKDGRLFVSCLNRVKEGCVFAINPDGSNYEDIVVGYSIDDIAFDEKGGFYFTDLRGDATNPIGGVYYVSPDFKKVSPFMPNMAGPNGVAISPDYSVLWVTESHTGRVHRVMLKGKNYTTKNVVYTTTGFYGPDSCEIDRDGNLYISMYGQGKVLILNHFGYPIGQVLMPNREQGHNLVVTHTDICPGTDDLYIIACDDNGDEGCWIFKTKAFAKSNDRSFQFL